VAAVFVGAEVELIDGGAGRAFLLQGLLFAVGERGKDGIEDTAHEVVV
jgi:hypothetical protein